MRPTQKLDSLRLENSTLLHLLRGLYFLDGAATPHLNRLEYDLDEAINELGGRFLGQAVPLQGSYPPPESR